MRHRTAFYLLGVVPCLLSTVLVAQDPTTGSIDGRVEDPDHLGLSGVALEARSPSLQGVRTTRSDAAGRFHLPSLPPGVYVLAARLSGFSSVEQPDVRVTLAETATVRLSMRLAVTSEIEVEGEAPILDVTSSAGGQNVREDVIRRLPVGRNYADILRVSPGVATDNADTQGRGVPFTIYGATSLENQYLVDGANTTNVIRGFQGKALPNEFIEEVQVKSSGYEAEYGRATGGVVNVITKSGGNDLHGDVFGYFAAKALTAGSKAANDTDAFSIVRSSEDRRDYGVDLGGPFVKDRLWFFGAYNRIDRDQDQLVVGQYVPTAGQNYPLALSANVYSAKLTFRASDSTTFVGTVFGDPEGREGSLRNFTSSAAVYRDGIRDIGGTDWTVSALRLFGTRALANARYARHRDNYSLRGESDGVQIRDHTQGPIVISSGGFGNVFGALENNQSERDSWKLDGTLFAGDHEIKGGVDYEKNRTESTDYFSGGQVVHKFRCPTAGRRCPPNETSYYLHNFFTSNVADPVGGLVPGGVTQSPRTNRLGVFVQDAFKTSAGLTLNAGLRYDEDDIRDHSDRRIFKLSGEWQPRIGLAWDVLRDGRSRVSASFGRFYYALPTDLSVLAYGNEIVGTTFNFSASALQQDSAAPRAAFVSGGASAEPVDAGLKGIYQDEVTAGFERAFDASFSVGVRYTYRNLGRVIEDRCDIDWGYPESLGNSCVLLNPGSDGRFATGRDVHACDGRDELGSDGNPPESQCGSLAIYPAAPIPAARRRYHALELVVRKQVKNVLWLQASYVYSSLRGNYDGAASNSFGAGGLDRTGYRVAQSDPGINQDFDYPALLVNADGRLFLDRPHSLRVDAAYTAPFGLSVGFQGFLRSGAPISRREAFGLNGYSTFVTERGSEGRQPWDYELDLQLQYPLRIGGVTLTAFAQGFNLLNRQAVLDSDQLVTLAPPTEPDYVNPNYGRATARRDPRSFVFGARVSF